ncbi:Ctr copper transporter [Aspergillus multicolor]|uniref:putative copper transporter crmD n=1 Tax=Aspergillus multicolor TaxID=41759 RepID=UPI003CCDA7FA
MDMDMNLDMDHVHNQKGHDMPMSMPAIFVSSTDVTLFFSAWTTASTFTYLLTLFALFTLAFLNRFLAALRFQLNLDHSEPPTFAIPIRAPPRSRRRTRTIPKARLSPLPRYLEVNSEEEETDNGHFARSDYEDQARHGLVSDEDKSRPSVALRVRECLASILPKWTPKAPWSWRGDGGRALLEGVRAFIGYILMLAVMTFNTGIFCTVLLGIVIGELVLGRYTQSSSAWQDGACHDR